MLDRDTFVRTFGRLAVVTSVIRMYADFRINSDKLYGRRQPGGYLTHGWTAAFCMRVARALFEAKERGWEFRWLYDEESPDWDCTDSASAINRCIHEHDGQHVESRCKDDGTGEGHQPGVLNSDCRYARFYRYNAPPDIMGCLLVAPCEEHEGGDEYADPHKCRSGCEVLGGLWGIEESRDYRECELYRCEVEAELAEEALATIREQEADERAEERAWLNSAAL